MPVVRPRATIWLDPRNHRPEEKAPSAVTSTARVAVPIRSRRRPRRSARTTTASATNTPRRTAASVAPWAVSLRSNSSAAKVMVWVMTVPR